MSTIVRSLAAIVVAVGIIALPAMAAQPQKGKPFVMAASALPSKKSPASIDWSRPAPKPRLGESVKVGPQPEPPGRRPDPFTPGGKTRFLPGSPGPASKLPGGGIAPAAKGIRESEIRERAGGMLRSMIWGRVKLKNCVGGPSNVRIRAIGGGRAHEVTGMPVPGNDFVIRYSIGGLTAGSYTLTPRLVGVRCAGGSWRPGTASVTIGSRITNVRRDFGYAVELAETRIPERILLDTIQGVFSGTQIRLDNYGSRHGDSWHVPAGSYVRFPRALGGRNMRFTIREARHGAFRYYVRDINLDRVRASREGSAVKLSFAFESAGTELKGHCWGTDFFLDPECPAGSDSTAPDGQLNNLKVDVFLTPARFVPRSGPVGLSFGDVRVAVSVSSDLNGIVGEFPGIDEFIENQVKRPTARQLTAMIDQRSVRELVAAQLRRALDALGIGTIREVRFVGSSLLIRHLPV